MSSQPEDGDGSSNDQSVEFTTPSSYDRRHPCLREKNRFHFYDLDDNERSLDISELVAKQRVWCASENGGRLDETMVGLDGGRWVLLFDPHDLTKDPSTQRTPPKVVSGNNLNVLPPLCRIVGGGSHGCSNHHSHDPAE